MPIPTVFISYSHADEAWTRKLLPQLRSLEQAGVEMDVWHDRKIDGGDQWYPEIQAAMSNAAAAILLISADFLASPFCVKEEVPFLLKRQEEQGMLLIPVLLRACVWKAHRWLRDRQMIPRDGKSVAIDFAGDLADSVFADVADRVLNHLQQLGAERRATFMVPAAVERLDALQTVAAEFGTIPPSSAIHGPVLSAERIDLTRLPETGSALFGRDAELTLLDEAWASREQTPSRPVRMLAFTAYGGVGKSTLVNHWLAEMACDNYRGAAHVFGWSFYSQGVRKETAASADTFVTEALNFFGDETTANGSASPWDKGERLAQLVGNQRSLLVLDGMEPLQSAHAFERGKLNDPALESLLRSLARQSSGLCLITTREPLPALQGRPGVTTRDLEQITPQAGRALLRTARVVATDAELEGLAGRFGPHALAVSLLGMYLREHPGRGISPAQALEQLPGEPIDRVLEGFEQWLGDSPERETLRLLGFFDRPADPGCLSALRKAPAIAGLTDRLAALSDAEWDNVLDRLQRLRLIQLICASSNQRSMDAHPLLREYFARRVRRQQPEAWRAAHRRLFEYLCGTTSDRKPKPTLRDLEPLYQAVVHGCQAGLGQEVCETVYRDRIQRGRESYSTRKLGALASDLGAVACFFEKRWNRISPGITEPAQAWLLNEAAVRLTGLGRLAKAVEPMHASREMCIRLEDWREAAVRAINLSETRLTLGEVAEAERDAEQAVTYADTYADRSRVQEAWMEKRDARTMLAHVLHQAGRRTEAETYFRKAEQMEANRPFSPLLYSLNGFLYCDLLLAVPERVAWQEVLGRDGSPSAPRQNATIASRLKSCRTVSKRAGQTLDRSVNVFRLGLLSIAVDRLTLGRAALYEATLDNSSLATCRAFLESAVTDLRLAGLQAYLCHGLLTRAWLRFLEGSRRGPESAESDLDEAWEIAERGPMRLHMADIHLYRARLFHAVTPYPWETPHADVAAARALIEQCGYWRRKDELEDAEAAAKNWQ